MVKGHALYMGGDLVDLKKHGTYFSRGSQKKTKKKNKKTKKEKKPTQRKKQKKTRSTIKKKKKKKGDTAPTQKQPRSGSGWPDLWGFKGS